MCARLFTLGAAMGMLAPLAGIGISPLTAAQAIWPDAAVPPASGAQTLFRPWGEMEFAGPDRRATRQKKSPTPRVGSLPDPSPPVAPTAEHGAVAGRTVRNRAGVRKAEPVTRSQDLGLQFRPGERIPAPGYGTSPSAGNPGIGLPQDPQLQFRPIERRRTYEEFQAERQPVIPPAVPSPGPMRPYPSLPAPPLPGLGSPWPNL